MKNKFLSLAWFKEKLRIEGREEKENREQHEKEVEVLKDRLFRNIKLINTHLTIVLDDGTVLSKPNATEEDYNNCMTALSVHEIKSIITGTENPLPKPVIEENPITVEDVKSIEKGFDILRELPDFSFEEDVIYWGEIKRSLPQQLVIALCKLVENGSEAPLNQNELDVNEQYLSLKKFWLKCCLNPNAQSAEDLYTFLSNHKFKIDRHGNFYAYRKVVSKHTNTVDKELMEFVSNSYTKVKAVWKYNPKNFTVHMGEEGYIIYDIRKKKYEDHKDTIIGNLAEMYSSITDTPGAQYTSAHTGREDYRIGEVISMPRNEGDDNNNISCSKGFHAASKKYDYSGFGDTPILMIINPTDVLSVPKGEVGKLRTCKWFFACVLDDKEKYILDEECFDVTDLGDIFESKIQANLEEDITRGFAEELHRHSFFVPAISEGDIKKIVKSLEEMQHIIKSRVENIK